MVNPEGVFQALREQSGMSTPIRATLWITQCVTNHLLSEQVFKEHGAVALRARPAHTDRTSKQVAGVAASLAEEALTASAALVDRVGHQRFAALERLAHTRQIGRGGLMAESITALLASARAVPRACRGRGPPHIRQPPGPSREPSRMGMSLDGVMATCSSGSSSAVSTTNCASCWIVLGRNNHRRGAQRTASSGPPARCSASSPASVPLVDAGAAATTSLSSDRPLSRNEGPLR